MLEEHVKHDRFLGEFSCILYCAGFPYFIAYLLPQDPPPPNQNKQTNSTVLKHSIRKGCIFISSVRGFPGGNNTRYKN